MTSRHCRHILAVVRRAKLAKSTLPGHTGGSAQKLTKSSLVHQRFLLARVVWKPNKSDSRHLRSTTKYYSSPTNNWTINSWWLKLCRVTTLPIIFYGIIVYMCWADQLLFSPIIFYGTTGWDRPNCYRIPYSLCCFVLIFSVFAACCGTRTSFLLLFFLQANCYE